MCEGREEEKQRSNCAFYFCVLGCESNREQGEKKKGKHSVRHQLGMRRKS